MKNVMKKFLSIVTAFAILATIMPIMESQPQLCAAAGTPLKEYAKILLQNENLNEEEDNQMPYFALCDINADGIKEMILSKGEHILSEKKYYTYKNGSVVEVKGPSGDDLYPAYGSLYLVPSRESYVFYRGGPAYDSEEGYGVMPYTIMEYKLVDKKIKLINNFYCGEYLSGEKAGTREYSLNGKPCTAEEYQSIYESFGDEIKFYANSKSNRIKYGVNQGKTGEKVKLSYMVIKLNKNETGNVILTGADSKKWKRKITTLTVKNNILINGKKFKITGIKENAFQNCPKLKSATIGKNIKNIGEKAFYQCKKLNKIIVKTTLLKEKNVGKNAFRGINENVIIIVPKSKLKMYRKLFRARGIGSKAENVVVSYEGAKGGILS